MDKYFRVTAYHKQANISVIFDSNGYLNALWELSSFLYEHGFDILEVGKDGKFSDGNIPRAEYNTENIILRACKMGKPVYTNGTLDVQGRRYQPVKN